MAVGLVFTRAAIVAKQGQWQAMSPLLAFRAVSLVALCGAFVLLSAPVRAEMAVTACLQPLGQHEAGLLGPIGRGIAKTYGFRVRELPPRALPKSAWYPPRNRYRAALLLDGLRARPAGCDFVLGFTAVDISMTKGEHADWGVLGLSYLRENVSVVSSFRMHREADRALLTQRAVKVSLHELGHAIGLGHRNEGTACLMNDAGGAIRTIDRARGSLCAGERREAEALLGRALPAD
jgi:archaemetzincin